jgi:ribosome biogenesis GTPase / thiamine phosphate phosphatase
MSRYDEEAKYDRPKRRTRPRTKDRPTYDEAVTAFVITRDRGRYTTWVGEGDRVVTAMKARQLGRKGVIVGDRVKLDGDASGAEGTLARIVEVLPRTTLLRRSADDDDPVERPLVANADQTLVRCCRRIGRSGWSRWRPSGTAISARCSSSCATGPA